MNRLSIVVVVLLSAILAGSVGCARKPDDAKISSDIKGKFSQDSGLSTKQLSVQASNGVVTLAGFVDNDAQRTAAALQAASVAGVKEVVNNLQVGSADIAAVQPGAKAASQSGASGVPQTRLTVPRGTTVPPVLRLMAQNPKTPRRRFHRKTLLQPRQNRPRLLHFLHPRRKRSRLSKAHRYQSA